MREPAFWYRPASWKSHLLRPLGALERTLAALEPYLMQLRIEMRAANA